MAAPSGGAAAARAHLEAIARAPRPAGGPAESRAREHCAARLRALGFSVREAPFAYSALPGRWATSLGGGAALLTLLAAGHLGAHGAPAAALGLLLAAAAALALGGGWVARRGVRSLPFLRARGVNLEARPTVQGEAVPPRVWLVAHLDSKSQPVPMLLRAGGITLTAVAWIAMLAVAVAAVAGAAPASALDALWRATAVLGALAALPVVASTVGASSPGALDDASGVASVLLAAERVAHLPVGVLLTSAEELGLAGARAWVHDRNPETRVPVLNCDGVDDGGELVLMHGGRRPTRLLDAMQAVADAGGPRARARRLIPGVLVDAVAFSDAGWEAATVSRGTPRTLRRIHRPADDLAHLRGDGVPEAAALLAALAERLASLAPLATDAHPEA